MNSRWHLGSDEALPRMRAQPSRRRNTRAIGTSVPQDSRLMTTDPPRNGAVAPALSRDLVSHVASLMHAATAKPSPPLCWFGLFGLLKQLGWAHEPKPQLPQSAVTVCSSPSFLLSRWLTRRPPSSQASSPFVWLDEY